MTAQPIAEVIDDLRKGRVNHQPSGVGPTADEKVWRAALQRVQRTEVVVDATPIYLDLHDRLIVKRQEIDIYGDHPSIASPWEDVAICCVNQHGNVIVMQLSSRPWPHVADKLVPWGIPDGSPVPPSPNWQVRWETPNDIDWSRVRWLQETFLWVGGRNSSGPMDTTGPCHLMQYAVYDDGEPADLHYVQLLPDIPLDTWEVPQLLLLASLSFLNCVNVTTAEPQRPRPERRRLARLGVQVQTLVVRPIGRRTAGSGAPLNGAVPLHRVRGHFAEYGERYGKGKLFGKLEGRYWIPGHARGSADHGEIVKDYLLKPGTGAA